MAVRKQDIEQSLARKKKLLIVLNKGDMLSTQCRVLRLIFHITKANYLVDVMVHNQELFDQIEENFAENEHVTVLFEKGEPVYWEPQRRDDFVKIFINQVSDIVIPGTDLPYWKTAAFDDFRGHISSHVFRDIESDYDLIILSVPSGDEPLATEADILSTTVLFHARECGIKVVGLQIFPAQQCPRIYMKMLDHIIIRNEIEKRHYIEQGYDPKNLTILSDRKDNYCVDTIEDTYKNMMFDRDIDIASNTLSILVLNHAKYRTQMKQAIDVICSLDIEKSVCFAKAGYEIRDLSEDQIFDDLIKPSLEKLGDTYYIIDSTALAKMLMICDVIITSTYISPVKFASGYGKGAIVYNPIKCVDREENGIQYCGDPEQLKKFLLTQYENKCSRTSISQILGELCK